MAGQRLIYGGPSSGGGGGCGGGSVLSNSVLLQNQRAHPPPPSSSSNKPLDSFFLSGSSSSSSFLGTPSMVSFEEGKNGSRRPFFQLYDQEENGDDEYDEYFQQPEKKRRLKAEQVQFLEKSFKTENKLEPDRKVQLAKELGLQPRQIAIWFQNRRARWKTKQLEKDFEVLQDSYNKLKANYDNLLKEKEKLKAEVHDLTDKLQLQGEKGNSESSDTKSPPEALEPDEIADFAYREEDLSKEISNEEGKHNDDNIVVTSDVLDSESPHYTDGAHSSLIEPADSPYAFEQELSDASQDEEDNFSMMFLPPLAACMFPKLESADNPCLPSNSGYLGFPISSDDNHSYDFWS